MLVLVTALGSALAHDPVIASDATLEQHYRARLADAAQHYDVCADRFNEQEYGEASRECGMSWEQLRLLKGMDASLPQTPASAQLVADAETVRGFVRRLLLRLDLVSEGVERKLRVEVGGSGGNGRAVYLDGQPAPASVVLIPLGPIGGGESLPEVAVPAGLTGSPALESPGR